MMQGKQETNQEDQRQRLDNDLDEEDFDQMQVDSNRRRGGMVGQQSNSDRGEFFKDENEALQMDDVSINLEDAVGSGEDLMPASSSNRKQ